MATDITDKPTTEGETPHRPNLAMLKAMADIAAIHKEMNPKDVKDSMEHLKEAREGAMYAADD